ncbi:MAG: hypothetical protein ABIH63_03915 [archaeon]
MSHKRIILKPEDRVDEPPSNLNIVGCFKRVGILNPAVVQRDNKIELLSRLIYEDYKGLNSCIIRNQAILEGEHIRIKKDKRGYPLEELVFQPEGPYGERGIEDARLIKLNVEDPIHGFVVHHNGQEYGDVRTEYLRTKENDPTTLLSWDRFGIYFPNIGLEEAIETVSSKIHKQRWETEDNCRLGRKTQSNPPSSPFLKTKDCCLWPRKIVKEGQEHYGVIVRLLPDMQIVYVRDFKELAKYEFWQGIMKNIEDYILLGIENYWENSHIGLAGPPFEINEGILIPYHGAIMKPERDYKFGLALADPNDPQKILARTKEPILVTTEPWETNGVVSGKVVFPTGHAIKEGIIHWFYGAGDRYVAHTTTTEKEILGSLF